MTDQELIKKVMEQAKENGVSELSEEDAQAAIDFIKDQTEFNLCEVIQEALEGDPKKLKKLRKNIEKVNNMPLYVAGGLAVAAVAVMAAPAVMAALPVLSGGAAAAAAGTTTATVLAADGVTVVGTALITDVAATTALATTGGAAAATGGTLAVAASAAGTALTSAATAAGTAITTAATSAATAAASITAADAAAVGVGALSGAALGAAEVKAGIAVADNFTGMVDDKSAAAAAVGISKALNNKGFMQALSTTLLIADICDVVREVAYYDVAINQGNTKLLESNYKVNPVYEEALWEVSDYDTQLYFVNTELARYSVNKDKLKKIIEKDVDEISGMTKTYKDAVIVYCNIVTSDNKMYMYVMMFNHAWFKEGKKSEVEERMTNHCKEVLSKHGITSDKIRYISLTAGKTILTNKEFLKGKDITEPANLYREGSRLRIPDLEKTEALTKAKEGDAAASNSIVGNVISNLSCEYVLNSLDKESTVYKFTGDIKSVKEAVLKTASILELSPLLCGDRKIRTTLAKLQDKLGITDSIGLVIVPDIGIATVNVLAGVDIVDKVVNNKVDKGLIITFTSAAGIAIESSLTHVKSVYLFWSLLGGAEVNKEQSDAVNQAQLDAADRNRGGFLKNYKFNHYKDKEGRNFILHSECVGIYPKHAILIGSYLSDNNLFRLTHRTVDDAVLLQNKEILKRLNNLLSFNKQGSFMKPRTTVSTSSTKDLKNLISPEMICTSLRSICSMKNGGTGSFTVLVHDKYNKRCHIFDYMAEKSCTLPDEEFKDFSKFPFTIDNESITVQQDRFDMFTF